MSRFFISRWNTGTNHLKKMHLHSRVTVIYKKNLKGEDLPPNEVYFYIVEPDEHLLNISFALVTFFNAAGCFKKENKQ